MDIIKEAMELGLGIFILTKKKTEKIVNELVKEGKLKRKEGARLIKKLIERGKVEEKYFEKKFAKAINLTFSKLDIATKGDIRKLEAKIRKLEAHKHR